MVYKQQRFNLQREETEGFAKLVVLLGSVREANALESEENMQRLIGYFDLDPNRCRLPWLGVHQCLCRKLCTSCRCW